MTPSLDRSESLPVMLGFCGGVGEQVQGRLHVPVWVRIVVMGSPARFKSQLGMEVDMAVSAWPHPEAAPSQCPSTELPNPVV